MKTDLLQSCGHCWVFQICWHIECSTFTASSFRIWNSSTGIPSPSPALFVVMLSKAHLTSHSRVSGYRWVITPWWLSGSWRYFLYRSSVYSCHLFLMSSASVKSIPSALYWAHLCMKSSLGISNFLEDSLGHQWPYFAFIYLQNCQVFSLFLPHILHCFYWDKIYINWNMQTLTWWFFSNTHTHTHTHTTALKDTRKFLRKILFLLSLASLNFPFVFTI